MAQASLSWPSANSPPARIGPLSGGINDMMIETRLPPGGKLSPQVTDEGDRNEWDPLGQ